MFNIIFYNGRYWIITAIISLVSLILLTLTSCGGSGEIIYKPPYIPIKIGVNTNGEITLAPSTEIGIRTNFGTFELGGNASYKIPNLRQSETYKDKRLLIVRVDSEVTVFELTEGEEFRIEFEDKNTGYNKVRLIYEDDGDIVLELEAAKSGIIAQVPTQLPTPTRKPPTATRKSSTPTPEPPPRPINTPSPTPPPDPPRAGWEQGKLVFFASYGNTNALYTMDIAHNLTTNQILNVSSEEKILGSTWSPNGQKITYYTFGNQVKVVDASGANRKTLHDCSTPGWSPDGSKIICRVKKPEPTFNIIDANSGQLLQQIPCSSGAVLPDWSPIRNELVYAAFEDDNTTSIYRLDLVNNQSVKLAGGSPINYAPAWSPDGDWIAYQSDQGLPVDEIWIMDRNGNNKTRLTTDASKGWSRAPTWSPDGQWLAYVSSKNGSIGPEFGEIFIISVDSGDQYQLTDTNGAIYNWRVSWAK